MKMAVALSGGVDSACAALLMKEAGHLVTGLHMKLTPGQNDAWPKARSVAESLDVPIELVDLTTHFQREIISYFVSEYSRGRTPSPCPPCNRKIKMKFLLEHAFRSGADKLVTGHYARIIEKDNAFHLLKGLDSAKDQSYFLFMLDQETLSNLYFPLGELTKTMARKIVAGHNLAVQCEQDSQELCFVHNALYTDFLLAQGAKPEPGHVMDADGLIIGKHRGIIFYTVGQRKGLGVCRPEPSYVIEINAENNSVIVGGKNSTLVSRILINNLTFISHERALAGSEFMVKVRSTSREAPCIIEEKRADALVVAFQSPQSGVAPGQAAVLYNGDEVIGGGWIERSLK
jgi:tRNA-uridine 2-sulfurtransferase